MTARNEQPDHIKALAAEVTAWPRMVPCANCGAEYPRQNSKDLTCCLPCRRARHNVRQASRRATLGGRTPDCHPHRPHEASGFCRRCYDKRIRDGLEPEELARRREKNRLYQKEWYLRARERRQEKNRLMRAGRDETMSREEGLFRRYGMSLADYDNMVAAQGGVCAICHRPARGKTPIGKRLYVDHDKSTGRVRGLLCAGCNTALGQYDHSPELLQRAIDYLERANNAPPDLNEQIRVMRKIARETGNPKLKAAVATLLTVKAERQRGQTSVAAISDAIRGTR